MESTELAPRLALRHRAVAAVVAAAVLLWWLPGTSGTEIYPSVSLPSFGHVPDPTIPVEHHFEITTSAGVVEATKAQMLGAVSGSAWPGVIEALMIDSTDPEVHAWLLDRGAEVVEGCVAEVVLVQTQGETRIEAVTANQDCTR